MVDMMQAVSFVITSWYLIALLVRDDGMICVKCLALFNHLQSLEKHL